MSQGEIMTIHCASCGAPAYFDIMTQNYHCPNCGENTGTELPVKQLQEFRSLTKTLMEQELPESKTIACECPNCGATVLVKEHEVSETCIFCNSKILRSDVTMSDGFPEMLIPFKLNRKQAEKQLEEWITKHSDKKETVILKENRKKLKGIYLPYELIRGPIRFRVTRDNSDRDYSCGGFLEHAAVNVTKRCNNLLLNGMEPFLWEDLEPFQFGYIAGHAAEVPTVDGKELKRRVFEEVAEEYRPTVEHTMQTTGLTLHPSSEALLRLPAFLPVYFMDCGNVQAAVNGQTGKVSVLAEKETKSYPWVIEPLIGTLAVMTAVFMFFRNYGGEPMEWGELIKLTGMLGLVAALILFTVFSKGRSARVQRKVFQSISEEGKRQEDAVEPVFFETIDGQEVPVKIGFYSAKRIVKMVLILLLVNASTCIVAWILTAFRSMISGDWTLFRQLDYSYNIIWLCISLPVSMAGFAVFGRLAVYDSPVLYQILENGSYRRIRQKKQQRKSQQVRWKETKDAFIGLVGVFWFVLLLYAMIVYMIMNP